MPASGATPVGNGTTGFQWWMTAWQYHAIYEPLEEALRSDGTPFVEVSDSDISGGLLMNSDGTLRYPIVISLAAEAALDEEFAPLQNFVNAGGTLVLGSSAMTRRTDGTSRGDFGLAQAMGLHVATPSLSNWYLDHSFTKVLDHRLVAHIPDGKLNWRMAVTDGEIPLGTPPWHPIHDSRYSWAVTAIDAQVIAVGDLGPLLSYKQNGLGRIIFYGDLQPLLGHGGHDSAMYAYGIFRNAIAWAFESVGSPLVRVSPWRYPYDAAMVIRHDFESNPDLINSIESSAQVEAAAGVSGDYFFCTGALRVNMANSAATIASLNNAVTAYGATIGSHNGGLTNPANTVLAPEAYDYWHWGPDEILNLTPPGFDSGIQYATVSVSDSFNDLEGWITGASPSRRIWVAPYFNGTREASSQLLDGLGVLTEGEQKAGPFPTWVLSSQAAGKRYGMLSLPTSDWYYGSDVIDALEMHSVWTLRACIDRYFSWGGLINNYGHVSSATAIGQNYIGYAMRKPRMWAAKALGVYDWWKLRSSVSASSSYNVVGTSAVVTTAVTGASDPDTAIEIAIPNWQSGAGDISQVLLNGQAATYRTNSNGIKVRVGSGNGTVIITYSQQPQANDDIYSVSVGTVLNAVAPGVLDNDRAPSGRNLSAVLVSGPAHGTLSFNANGSFTYTPNSGWNGTDTFTYKANDGQFESVPAVVTIGTVFTQTIFADDFSDGNVAPWNVVLGTWTNTAGALSAVGEPNSVALAYVGTGWSDYVVQGQIQFTSDNSPSGGIAGRYNPASGARYAAIVFPQGSLGSQAILRLLKFYDWFTWSYIPMQEVILPPVGTSPHILQLGFQGSQISVTYDGNTLIDLSDNGFDGYSAFGSGGTSLEFYPGGTPGQMTVDNVSVTVSSVAASHPMLVINVNNQSRNYGQDNPALTGSLSGVIDGDGITASYMTTAALNSGVGDYSIFPIISDPNNRLGNYIVVTNLGTLTVTPAVLTVGAVATSKVYDGTNTAMVTLSANRIGNDDVSITYTNAIFADKHVGLGKAVTVSGLALTGSAANNYSLVSRIATTIADISARPVTVAAVADTKVYDGTLRSAQIPIMSLGSLAVGDSAMFAQAFDTKNVGTAKVLIPIGTISDGNGGNDYALVFANANLGTITSRALIISATGQNKIYDGTTTATVTLSDNRVPGDQLAESYGSAAFLDRNIGSGKTINVSGITVSGSDSGNYTANTTAVTAADITLAALLVRADNATRTYGATNPALTVSYSGFIGGDTQASVIGGTPSLSTTATSNSPVGSYPIAVSAGSLKATNYTVSYINGVLTVTPAPLLVKANNFTRNVGQTNPAFTATMAGFISPSDTNQVSGNLTFTTPAMTNSPAGTYPITPAGLASTNYSITYSNGTLTVVPNSSTVAPTIASNPLNQSTNAGCCVSFSVAATGTAPMTYQWFKNGTTTLTDGAKVSGSTRATLTLSNVFGADRGSYSVVVSNSAGRATSSAAILAVNDPIISSQPASVMTNSGAQVRFTVCTVGTSPTYRWYKNNTVLADGGNVSGCGTATLTLARAASGDAATYCVLVANSYGSVTSAVATLSLFSAPVIGSQPSSRTNAVGSTAVFSVAATGVPAPAYQWRKGNTPISGATAATLTLPNVTAGDAGSYNVVVSNIAGSVTSASAALAVWDSPRITAQPASVTNLAGATATFRVSAAGTSLSYRWLKNVTNQVANSCDISGATTSALTIGNLERSDAGAYTVVVSNAVGAVTSSPAALVVYAPPQLPDICFQIVNEQTLLRVTNTASDSNVSAKGLRYTLVNPPSGATITTNGIISWTPTESQGFGIYLITTVVTETVSPSLSDSNCIIVIVNELNKPPVLPKQQDRSVTLKKALVVTNTATDPDDPDNCLCYSLVNPPQGASIDSSGVIRWTPSSTGTFVITTVVSDFNLLAVNDQFMSATNMFTVKVSKSLTGSRTALQSYTIDAGQTITVTNTSDLSSMTQPVTYTLVSGPLNAKVDPVNGTFTWRGTATSSGSANYVQVGASDSAQPAHSTVEDFVINVNPPAAFKMTPLGKFGDEFRLQVEGPIGPDYILERADGPIGSSWLPIATNTPDSMPFIMIDTSSSGVTNGIYRLRIAP